MRRYAIQGAILAVVVVSIGGSFQGCAVYKLAGTPLAKLYVAADDYRSAQEVAISVLQDPNTPAGVKTAIKRADAAGNAALHTAVALADEYRTARKLVTDAQDAGQTPSADAILAAEVALQRLKAAIVRVMPLIEALQNAVRAAL